MIDPIAFFKTARARTYRLSFQDINGATLASGSGFWANGKLITNNHVFAGPPCDHVTIQCEAKLGSFTVVKLSRKDFASRLVVGSDEQHHDYAVLDVPELASQSDFEFRLKGHNELEVGHDCALFGFPFGSPNLAIHKGSVSSIYKSGVADAIQVDASVNQSNSGGPLVDMATGEVVGIITRKATGLSKAFADLKKTLRENIKLLDPSKRTGAVIISGFDPLVIAHAAQHQMLITVGEIERSANVGIGVAFSVNTLMSEGCFQ